MFFSRVGNRHTRATFQKIYRDRSPERPGPTRDYGNSILHVHEDASHRLISKGTEMIAEAPAR
jgi:hypothetical protein